MSKISEKVTGREGAEGEALRESLDMSVGQAQSYGLYIAAKTGMVLATAQQQLLNAQNRDEMLAVEEALETGAPLPKGNPLDLSDPFCVRSKHRPTATKALWYSVNFETRDSIALNAVKEFCNIGEFDNAQKWVDWLTRHGKPFAAQGQAIVDAWPRP